MLSQPRVELSCAMDVEVDFFLDVLGIVVRRIPDAIVDRHKLAQEERHHHTMRAADDDTRMDREVARREQWMLLGEAPLVFELTQRIEDQHALIDRIDANARTIATGTERVATHRRVRRLARDRHRKPEQTRRDRHHRQRRRRRARLRDNCGIRGVATLDRRGDATLVVHYLFTDNSLEDQIALQRDPALLQCARGKSLRHDPGLHIGRTATPDAVVVDLAAKRIATRPVGGIADRYDVDMTVVDQRAPPASAFDDADGILTARLNRK